MKRLVIRNVGPIKSVDISLNKVNVFIGPQGSGKSTIARLIASLWYVGSGSITLGNRDIRDIPEETYSDRVAFV